MLFLRTCARFLALVASVLGLVSRSSAKETIHRETRAVTVADTIQMTRVGGPPQAASYMGVGPKTGFAAFSPDGRRFAIVLRKGNLEANTNDYSLLVFPSGVTSFSPPPRSLITFASSSNDDGISSVTWLADNDTILFLGSRGSDPVQLYSLRCSSGTLRQLTSHGTSLMSYSASRDASKIVYVARSPSRDVIGENVLKYGYEVTSELLPDLAAGKIKGHETELYVKESSGTESRLPTQGPSHPGAGALFLSPDGHYVLLKTDARELPDTWKKYEDETIRAAFRRKVPPGSSSLLLSYEVVDTTTGASTILLDAPAPFGPDNVIWSPNSKSLLLCGVYLPLDVSDPVELRSRREHRFVVEAQIPSRTIVKITDENLRPVRWDPETNVVQFYSDRIRIGSNDSPEPVYYLQRGALWEKHSGLPEGTPDVRPDIRIEEDLNVPPQIFRVDGQTGQHTLLFDLNPQFANLRFGRVEEIQWTDDKGRTATGGLYFPPDYEPGRRYPLVIQTHGFDPHAFWIDGPWTTSFAAQPLANRGIVVLQMNDTFREALDTADELERAMKSYEGAIAHLTKKEIIDPARVGLVGFSRTCLYVKYALTHSRIRFAAAVVSDGFDGGYFEYLVLANAVPLAASEIENIVGSAPFGAGLSDWARNSPGFLLHKVRTPVQLEANEPASLFGEWEWFSGLTRLSKPVDLLYLPTGTHILIQPWDRLVSQGRTVDWFRFWLKGEEDSDPAKAAQFDRWRDFRRRLADLDLN